MPPTDEASRPQASPDSYLPRFASLALGCVRREYPNKIDHTLDDDSQVPTSRHYRTNLRRLLGRDDA